MRISRFQKSMMRARQPMQFWDPAPSSAAIKRSHRSEYEPERGVSGEHGALVEKWEVAR